MRQRICTSVLLFCLAGSALAEGLDRAQTEPAQSSGNLINSVTTSVKDTLGSAMGIVTLEHFRHEGQDGIPRRIAVLPATGFGDDAEREDISISVHNNLSSKNFELLQPFDIERTFTLIEQSGQGQALDLSPAELAKRLDVEGLIYVDVENISKVYAAAYAHYEITVKLRFYDRHQGKVFWEKTEAIAEREGGVSLTPLGFITTAISSASVLSDGVRQMLVDKLARNFAREIPFPKGHKRRTEAPKIDAAFSNASQGPFRAGEEVLVFMRSEPGLAATFSIGQVATNLPLIEKGEGEYIGRHIVPDDQNVRDQTIQIQATRIKDKSTINWRVAGRIAIDTVPPEAVQRIDSHPTSDGVKISWTLPELAKERISYRIERADLHSRRFETLATTEINQFADQQVEPGRSYYYRVTALDEAGNESLQRQVQVTAVQAGPTPVSSDIDQDTTYYAVASPYIIQQPLRVLRHATLSIQPGTIVQFEGQGSLQVLGRIRAQGSAEQPITLQGDTMRLEFLNAGRNRSEFAYCKLTGEDATLQLVDTDLTLSHCRIQEMGTALALKGDSRASIDHTIFQRNRTGISAAGAQLTLGAGVVFSNNQIGLELSGDSSAANTALQFNDNQVSVKTTRPLTLQDPRFRDLSYPEIMTNLEGPIALTWAPQEGQQDPKAQWLESQWLRLFDLATQRRWSELLTTIGGLEAMQIDESGFAVLKDAGTLLGTSTPSRPTSSLGQSLTQIDAKDDGRTFWLQRVRIPYRARIESSQSYLLKQAMNRAHRDYFAEHYEQIANRRLTRHRRQLDIQQFVEGSELLYGQRDGLFYEYWVAHVVDHAKLRYQLISAGLMVDENLDLVVALVGNQNTDSVIARLITEFDAKGIRVLNLGFGLYAEPLRQRAVEQGAHLVVEAKIDASINASTLSPNLKIADVVMGLAVYDVANNDMLRRLQGSGNAVDFKSQHAQDKAATTAIGNLERGLFATLLQYAAERNAAGNVAESPPPADAPNLKPAG